MCSTVGQSDLPVREMQKATLICNNFLMCGRYRLSRRKQVVEEYFDTAPVEHDWNPRYNITPTQNVPIIPQDPKEPVREMSFVCWGLIPSWAKAPYAKLAESVRDHAGTNRDLCTGLHCSVV